MTRAALVVALATLAALVAPAHAGPGRIAFAGRLHTAAGPVTGDVSISFAIYDQAEEGARLWAETQDLTAQDGLILAELGARTTLDETVFAGDGRWLAIAVNGEALAPRVPLLAVPYALRAASAEALGRLAEADVQRRVLPCAEGSAIRAIDADGKPTCEPDDSAVLTAGPGLKVAGNKLQLGECPTGQVWRSTGSSWACAAPPGLTSCAWEKETNASSSASVSASCPAGKHAISGGCDPASTATVAYTAPSPLPGDGADASKVSAWKCQFSVAAVGHSAFALCCAVN